MCFNLFLYADDLLLLSISVTDMQKMVDIVRTELDWLDMSINIHKSVCLRIRRRYDAPTSEIVIANIPIKARREFKYLGMFIVAAKSSKLNLHQAKNEIFQKSEWYSKENWIKLSN